MVICQCLFLAIMKIYFQFLCSHVTFSFQLPGAYCSQDVAIKVLKPERVNVDTSREFSHEVYIRRSVISYMISFSSGKLFQDTMSFENKLVFSTFMYLQHLTYYYFLCYKKKEWLKKKKPHHCFYWKKLCVQPLIVSTEA
jgi:hypothetical protein